MKKIIRNKVYDTDTATALGPYSNDLSPDDPNWCVEVLYRKRTGEHFLYGNGGENTRYATISRGEFAGMSYGEGIIPLSYDAAIKWASEHLAAETYNRIFADTTDSGKVKLCVYVSDAAAGKVKRIAGKKAKSISAVVEDLITREVE